jgi:hypothetical protein
LAAATLVMFFSLGAFHPCPALQANSALAAGNYPLCGLNGLCRYDVESCEAIDDPIWRLRA